jgi:hypothetical protein
MRHPIVALDFDGTLVTHQYPDIGRDVGALYELDKIKLVYPHIRYILWTVRCGDLLDHAVAYCTFTGINLWGVNENPTQKEWSQSPKAHADFYVDDAALGTELIMAADCARPFVNWKVMGPLLLHRIGRYYQTDLRAR